MPDRCAGSLLPIFFDLCSTVRALQYWAAREPTPVGTNGFNPDATSTSLATSAQRLAHLPPQRLKTLRRRLDFVRSVRLREDAEPSFVNEIALLPASPKLAAQWAPRAGSVAPLESASLYSRETSAASATADVVTMTRGNTTDSEGVDVRVLGHPSKQHIGALFHC
mmetsp:Transcript_71984/g.192261  ORF Transcript_71984/g.192261 Transcript_71984/m.192261 type:complete len:166 (+) Transcript_71984:896-1393(+)